jgi:hypothetical protein
MKELKSIFGLLLILVGGFVVYKVVPAFWGDYKLGRLIEEQSVIYTYSPKSDQGIADLISEKAAELNVPLAPEQVSVQRTPMGLKISAEYSVHVELPIHPLDLNFKTSNDNKNVMIKKKD